MTVMYLEYVIMRGEAQGEVEIHDMYAQMLMEGIPIESTDNHASNDLSIPFDTSSPSSLSLSLSHPTPGNGEREKEREREIQAQLPISDLPLLLYKIYRAKLQAFLESPLSEYRPERVMKFLPTQFLHEYALLVSRLGKHEEALRIYVHQLHDLELSEQYCDRIYTLSTKAADEREREGGKERERERKKRTSCRI